MACTSLHLTFIADPGNSYWRGKFNTIELLVKIACFVKKDIQCFSRKRSRSELVSTRRSIVLVFPLQNRFHGWHFSFVWDIPLSVRWKFKVFIWKNSFIVWIPFCFYLAYFILFQKKISRIIYIKLFLQ
jgi:hypothetical protein